MSDVKYIEKVKLPDPESTGIDSGVFLNTGVPHLVIFVNDVDTIDVDSTGRALRNLEQFSPAGTNVNFVRIQESVLFVRTYERGVEGETLACGTGNVAAALAADWSLKTGHSDYHCHAVGGDLRVSFQRQDEQYSQVWLEGPAVKVFEGRVEVDEEY